MRISPRAFQHLALQDFASAADIPGKWYRPRKLKLQQYTALFKLTPKECVILWNRLEDSVEDEGDDPITFKPRHLLWALNFMKEYRTFDSMSSTIGHDEKTIRKWVWIVCHYLATKNWIDWDDRLIDDNGSICKVTVDGTDFRIQEPIPFDEKWYGHKFNGAGVRYLVGVCIQTGWIVYVHGPYPCGSWPDLRIARDDLCYLLAESDFEDEMALADGGFNDDYEFFETPTGANDEDQYMKAVARARHECINRKFKVWRALHEIWRHPVPKHALVFHAVTNITQLFFEISGIDGTPAEARNWDVAYYDRNDEGPWSDNGSTDAEEDEEEEE